MTIPFRYAISNFRSRRLTTAITIVGVALVVFVFAAVLMMAYGVHKTLQTTGSESNAIILRKSATSEISSIIDGQTRSLVESLPGIATDEEGQLILSGEPVVVINLTTEDGGISNVTVRGVSTQVSELRPQFTVANGTMFNPSLRELVVGEAIAEKYAEAQIGKKLTIAGEEWDIVGSFSTDGTGFDSEIWGNDIQLQDAFNRGNTVSTITVQLEDPSAFDEFQQLFEADKRLEQFEARIENEYFGSQSSALSGFIGLVGTFITIIFAVGATVGAMITLYAAVANRTVEIGTLRALGFTRTSILTVFLFESLIIAGLGGLLGIFLASFLQLFSISTMNFQSFSEISFSFALSPIIVFGSIAWALLMGFFGGFLPSVRAARLKIVNALRAG